MGGAISDLVSRVNNLEQQKIYPDYKTRTTIVEYSDIKSFLAGYVEGENFETAPLVIPKDGWVRVYISFKNSQGKNCELRLTINGSTQTFATANNGNDYTNEFYGLVKQGDKLSFQIFTSVSGRVAPTSIYITVSIMSFR